MKIVPTPLIICFLAVGTFLIGTGCNPERNERTKKPRGTPSKLEQWKSRVGLLKSLDYNVLSVEESELWLVEHSSVTIDNRWFEDLDFLAQKRVEDGSIITKDHNDNLRVAVRKPLLLPPPRPDPFAGFMTAEESEKWLRNNHYQVQKKADGNGYIITRNITREGFNYKGSWTVSNSSIIIPGQPIPHGYVNIDKTGRLRVKVTDTQQ